MAIRAGSGKRYEVLLGSEPVPRAFSVWALWNGGLGIVGYFPVDVAGHVYRDPNGDRLASAYRVGIVKVRELE